MPRLPLPAWLPLVLCAGAMLMLARPYEGVQHDAVLYLGQVLAREQVPVLRTDVFFAGGSQDAFTIYSWLMAPLYQRLGIGLSHQLLLAASLLASMAAVLTLLRHLGLGMAAAWGLLALAVMSPLYGGLRIFRFTEAFLTARSLAEPLVLWSLVALAHERLRSAALLQFSAALFHPLMALPGLAITWLLAVHHDRRWLALLAGVPVIVALALVGLAPLDRLVQTYDSFWWALVSQANPQVLLSNWRLSDWLAALVDACVLLSARQVIPREAGRRLLTALLLAGVLLLLLGFIGADLLHSVLLTQLQLWRALWLLHLMAIALAPLVLWHAWQQGGFWRVSAAFLALALMNNHAGQSYGALLLAGCAGSAWVAHRRWPVSPTVSWLGAMVCALALFGLNAAYLATELDRLYWHPPVWPVLDMISHAVTAPVVAFGAAGLLTWAASRDTSRTAALLASALLLIGALATWDRRNDLARAVESAPVEHPFQHVIPPQATVYWPERVAETWGLLARVSHYSRPQGAGLLFNRTTAELIAPRRAAYAPIGAGRGQCETSVALARGRPEALTACATPTTGQLHALCGGTERPDFMVFETALPAAPLATWDTRQHKLHLYACTQFSAAPATDRPHHKAPPP